MDNAGFWSVIPPLLTLVLAIACKDVIFALVSGILSGVFIVAVQTGNWGYLFTGLADKIADNLGDSWNIRIFLFCALLGGLVAILARTGAVVSFGQWAATKISSRRGTLFCTFGLGIVIFIDDYFNSLAIGTAMRPIADRMKISRAKLSYILDSTAAPVCIIAPVSSWVVTVMTYLRDSEGFETLQVSEMDFFLHVIPYNLYVLFSLLMVLCVCWGIPDFGAMRRAEKRAISGLGLNNPELYGEGVANAGGEDIASDGKKRARPWDMLIAIGVLIVTSIVLFPVTAWRQGQFEDGKIVKSFSQSMTEIPLGDAFRETDVSYALLYAIVLTLIIVIVYFVANRLLAIREISTTLIEGMRSMIPALAVLALAWAIGKVIRCTPDEGGVGLANYLADIVRDGYFPLILLPVALFGIACVTAFSTGTSWGTMAILIPITMPIAVSASAAYGIVGAEQVELVAYIVAAAIGGSIFGDHASPVSDTTILSATGAGCSCLEHVTTQFPYALFIAVCSVCGYGAGSFFWQYPIAGTNLFWSLPVSILVTGICFAVGVFILIPFFAKRDEQLQNNN